MEEGCNHVIEHKRCVMSCRWRLVAMGVRSEWLSSFFHNIQHDCHVPLSSRINYLYIPEGNKTHAMYWTTEYWIPELVRRNVGYSFLPSVHHLTCGQ